MPRQIALSRLVKATLDGIKHAETAHEKWSDGWTLSHTAEHVLYGFIANSIMNLPGKKSVEIEPRCRDIIRESCGNRKGRLPRAIRPDGHIDMVVCWGSGKSRAVIEIKNNVYNYNGQCESDIKRIAGMLQKTNVSLRFGMFAFFCSADTGKNKTAKEKLEHRFNSIKSRISGYCEPNIRVTGDYRVVEYDDSAYLCACIVMQPLKAH
jgi:hypothetical protein